MGEYCLIVLNYPARASDHAPTFGTATICTPVSFVGLLSWACLLFCGLAGDLSAQVITVQPQSQTVTAPAAATFTATATGTAPLLYQWNKNGAAISGATSASYTTPATTTGTNGANFAVTVTNSFGSSTSNPAILTVNPAPTLNLPPVGPVLVGGQPQNQTVVAPSAATFSATAIGTSPITYQWSKNGVPINGATSATYTTPATTSADSGASFTVTLTNSVNSFTSYPAALTVTLALIGPRIFAQPLNVYTVQGGSASFYVFATGTAPLSYQWSKNGTPIGGATDSSFRLPTTTSADDQAQYTVTVTNSAGVVTSLPAALNVASNEDGLGGFEAQFPGNPSDITGVQYKLQVVTNQSQSIRIVFGSEHTYTPGSAIGYLIESDLFSGSLTFKNGGCTTSPPLGTYIDGQATLRNAAPDYPYNYGQQPALGSGINTSDSVNWPIQTYLIDNIPNLYKTEAISQFNVNSLEMSVTIQRGATLTDVSSFQRCGLPMLSGVYRMWTITTQVTGHPTVVNQVVLPDAQARYLLPVTSMQFASEYLNFPGTFTVQYWDFAYTRESNPVWTPVSTFITEYNYDGNGQDYGIRVVSVDGQDRVEFSNVPGNSYLPGNLPFSIVEGLTTTAPPAVPGTGVTDGAGFSARISGGGIGSIFGTNLAAAQTSATATPLPTTLGGVSVTMNGAAVPLFFVSPLQINFQIPWELLPLSTTTLTVTTPGGTSPAITVSLSSTGPGIFTINTANSSTQGAIQIANTTTFAAPLGAIIGAASRPATTGDILTIYCSGLGAVTNRPADGFAAGRGSSLSNVLAHVTVTIGGTSAPVSFAGLAPAFVGLYQVNVSLPAGVASGNAVPVIVSTANLSSNIATIAVQ